MNWRDRIYMTRKRAIELGATHEAIHFGIPHWAWLDEADPDDMEACPKCGLLEPLVTLCLHAHAFFNGMRDPDDQVDFAFLVKPIGEVHA